MSRSHSLSLDGKRVAAVTAGGVAVASIDGGEPQMLRGSQPGDQPIHWGKDGSYMYVGQRGDTACQAFRLDLQTGARTPWKTFHPADLAGVVGVACPILAADEQHYVFSYTRGLSDLFLVEHLK